MATHIGLLLARNHKPSFADYYAKHQPFCLETCCIDVKCSDMLDNNQNPYQCLSEKDWHDKCLPASDTLCKNDGNRVQNMIVQNYSARMRRCFTI